jgi:hypothetical protein
MKQQHYKIAILSNRMQPTQTNITKYQKCGIKRDRYFVNEVETQIRGKTTSGQPNSGNLLSEDKARTKIVTLTYPMQRSYLAL